MSTVKTVYYEKSGGDPTVYSYRWWLEEKPHTDIERIVKKIRSANDARHKRNLFMAQLYENEELVGFGAGQYGSQKALTVRSQRLTLNVIKSCVDTVVSRIGTNKPRPMAVTDDALWPEQKRAEKLTSYLEGLYEDIGVWREGRLALRDACVLGTGVLKFYRNGDKVGVDRVIVDELSVDETEAVYGEPRSMYQSRYVAKDVLKEMFPSFKKEIESADVGVDAGVVNGKEADMVLVHEAWHLPSGKGANDGRHAVVINTATLFTEEWKKEWFPFAFMRYTDRLMGFYGKSLAEEIVGVQLEINKMLRNIAQAQHLFSFPQIWLDLASKTIANNLSNEYGGVRYYAGQQPYFMTPSAMPPEYYAHLETLYRRAFEICGISQLSAQSQKPAGLNSGVALRTMQDVESDRFKWTSQKFDEMFLKAADIIVDLNNDILESGVNMKVKAKKGTGIKALSWKDVKMDIAAYTMRLYPTSLLPSQPEGKYERVAEMMGNQMIDADDAASLLDMPDIKAVTSRKLSPRSVVLKILGDIIEEGKYRTPEPYMDLGLCKNLAQLTYLDCIVKGVPADRTDLVLGWLSEVNALIEQAKQQQTPPIVDDPAAMQAASLNPDMPMVDPMAQAI